TTLFRSPEDVPAKLKATLEEIKEELNHQRLTDEIISVSKTTAYKELARLSYMARRELKNPVYRLLHHFAKLDAWRALAVATVKNKWIFPKIQPSLPVTMEAAGLYHPLLRVPVAYDIGDRKSTRLNSSHVKISYAVFCL